MSLRNRIALIFSLLLAAVLTAALIAVSVANHRNADRAMSQQMENNDNLLRSAAGAVANDAAFHDALADRDTDTLASALENATARVNAALAILTSLDGSVLAVSGLKVAAQSPFPLEALRQGGREHTPHLMLGDDDKLYQIVAVPVRSPLTVAWIVMGFELDETGDLLRKIGTLGVSVLRQSAHGWSYTERADPTASHAHTEPGTAGSDAHFLKNALDAAQAPFARLTATLFIIAAISLLGFTWAAFWIARNITRPLSELTRSVARIREGDYALPQCLPRRDELGVLAEGLQLMSTAVMNRDQSIRQLAFQDELTRLMNRTAFKSSLTDALQAAAGASIGVAIINLHRFRRINEHLGFAVGDSVLRTTAMRLAAVPSVGPAAARLAADEFAAYTRLDDAAALQSWGASLLAALAEPVLVESQPIDISATVGLALAATGDVAADDLLRQADIALDQARRDKRAVAIHDEKRTPASRDQLSLLGELRRALEQDELRLYFQPKMELATGRVAGAEVLLRWQHPVRGLLGPGAFIPFAEQTGFIRRITRWTLDRAIAQGTAWHRAGIALPLAVNISADDLGDPRLDARVAGLLTRHQLPPSLLTLEVTESGFIEDPAQALGMLDALALLHVGISIDDFGTGYSSLSHLARMPADEVKIDRSFVLGLESNAEFGAVVKSAIDMGHSLGLKVVAEGIETETAAQRLRAYGCDIGQGYLFAKPMGITDFERWLEGRALTPVIAVPLHFSADEVTDTQSIATY